MTQHRTAFLGPGHFLRHTGNVVRGVGDLPADLKLGKVSFAGAQTSCRRGSRRQLHRAWHRVGGVDRSRHRFQIGVAVGLNHFPITPFGRHRECRGRTLRRASRARRGREARRDVVDCVGGFRHVTKIRVTTRGGAARRCARGTSESGCSTAIPLNFLCHTRHIVDGIDGSRLGGVMREASMHWAATVTHYCSCGAAPHRHFTTPASGRQNHVRRVSVPHRQNWEWGHKNRLRSRSTRLSLTGLPLFATEGREPPLISRTLGTVAVRERTPSV